MSHNFDTFVKVGLLLQVNSYTLPRNVHDEVRVDSLPVSCC